MMLSMLILVAKNVDRMLLEENTSDPVIKDYIL